jgi:hypothetical protein
MTATFQANEKMTSGINFLSACAIRRQWADPVRIEDGSAGGLPEGTLASEGSPSLWWLSRIVLTVVIASNLAPHVILTGVRPVSSKLFSEA